MKNILLILIISLAGFIACTDLEPTVYTEIVDENFFKTEDQVFSAAGPAYSSLIAYSNPDCIWGLNSLTTDELMIPTRGEHWDNDGIYRRFHKHEWLTTDFSINNSWKTAFAGVANCNRVIDLYENIEEKSDALISITNELQALRAYYYFVLMDLFGNIPIVAEFDVPEGYAPPNNTREEVFNFIEEELVNGIPVLNNSTEMDTYGRLHRYAAFALLAKLYLNAEVYTGQSMWDETIEACDSVINSGAYILSEDYFENFAVDNENSNENIFVIPHTNLMEANWGDDIYPARMFQHFAWTLHNSGHLAFNCQQAGWNGMCGVPSFYESYDEDDIRRDAWLAGPQYDYFTGDPIMVGDDTLSYTVEVNSIEHAEDMQGVRIAKYDYTGVTNYQMENDLVLLRYADVLLMKAEALIRRNGGSATQEAVDLVNEVRARAFPGDPGKLYTTGTLTLDALLAERGWEFAGEGLRRNDLIRFGKYNDPLDFRPTATAETYNLFPIPEPQINANPNLTQNDGY